MNGEVRDYTPEDEEQLDVIVKGILGEQAVGRFLGVKSKGVVGDQGIYGHAVIVDDPDIINHRDDWFEYCERLDEIRSTVSGQMDIVTSVTVEMTYLSQQNH